jgi:hypothetical protein
VSRGRGAFVGRLAGVKEWGRLTVPLPLTAIQGSEPSYPQGSGVEQYPRRKSKIKLCGLGELAMLDTVALFALIVMVAAVCIVAAISTSGASATSVLSRYREPS